MASGDTSLRKIDLWPSLLTTQYLQILISVKNKNGMWVGSHISQKGWEKVVKA